MRKMLRPAAAAMATLSTVMLLGCAAHNNAGPGGEPQAFTVDTPLDVIAADHDGMAILVKDVPGVMFSSKYPLIEDMSLTQIATLADGKLPASKLTQVQTDLSQLAAQRAAARQAAAQQAAAQAAAKKAAAAKAAPAPAPIPAAN